MTPAAASATLWLVAAAAAGLALSRGALHVHTRVFGFLPEDRPGGPRKQHSRPTPMCGFVLAAAAAVWLLVRGNAPIAGAAAILGAVGWVADRYKAQGGGSWKARAVVQLAAAGLIAGDIVPRAGAFEWLLVVALAFVLINAVNFLDNMDGVAAALGGMGVVLATRGEGPLAAAGALWLGFLPCNWPRARLFLGDGGALPLGGLLAAATLHGSAVAEGVVSWAKFFAPAAVPYLDFVQVVCARLWLGYAPWIGDRRHLTHIVNYLGVPAVAVMPVMVAVGVGVWWGLVGW